jgi:hypothetical protein
MATSLSILISDTSGCVILRRLSIAPVSGQPWEDFQLNHLVLASCVLGCCTLRGSDRFTPTVSIRQRQHHASTRTKDDIEKISHVYVDLDHGGTASIVTARFRVLYVFVIMEVGTRRIAHVNVSAHPTAGRRGV